jgi:GNAT superfamily N-acetyltransferase
MFQIKEMSTEDLAFAIHLTEKAGWGLSEEDFKFMMELEPKGCFALLQDSKRVGVATCVSFDKIAWFGNLIVSEESRKKGAGSLLVKHSIEYLMGRKVRTVGLYAYIDKVPFYERLEFKYDSEFVVLKGRGFSSHIETSLRPAQKQDLQEIIDYDATCFCASRKKSLEPILLDSDNQCCTYVDDGQIQGYAVAKVYKGMAELGPVVCQQARSDVAIDLLKAVLNKLKGADVSMCIPKKESSIINMLISSGFKESFRVARMFYGPQLSEQCICIPESLERG